MNPAPKKILIVGPSWVGDMVMAQSLFKFLKSHFPGYTLDVLAPAWSHGLLQRMPEIARSWVSPFKHGELKLWQRYKLGKKLRAEKYDQVIVLTNSFKSALTPWWARIPLRTGWHGEWPRKWLLLNDARKLDKQLLSLMVQRYVALGLPQGAMLPEVVPRPALKINRADLKAAMAKHNLTLPEGPILALAPGAEFGVSKRWPPEYYAEVAAAKIAQGWSVWLFGSANDKPVAEIIQNHTQDACVDLVGKTTLAEAIDLLSLASALVGNDSGLTHIAAGLNLPIVAIYGPTAPTFAPPLADRVEILSIGLPCSPCYKRQCPLGHWRCMLDVKPAAVLKSLQRLVRA